MRHLVIAQRQKAPNFSAFHWSPHGCLITIGQHFVTTMVVHLPKRTETSLITESDQSRANHQLLQLCTVRTAWSDSDQDVWAVHTCKSWLIYEFGLVIWVLVPLDIVLILDHCISITFKCRSTSSWFPTFSNICHQNVTYLRSHTISYGQLFEILM